MSNLKAKIARIDQSHLVMGRIKAQLAFAHRLSEVENGSFDDEINDAADYLISLIDEGTAPTMEHCLKFESMLSRTAKAAKEYTVHLVAHAHIDMNWQWGYQETSNIVLDTFRTMLTLMDEYPQFKFSQSQISTYKMCKELDPELFEKIKAAIKQGRWEVSASTWTEGDKNIPSSESLCRHYLYSKQFAKENFGIESEDLCLDFEPDTFGHNAFMPEILEMGEIKYYYHCRGCENNYAYIYKAPNGSEVLVYQDPYFYGGSVHDYYFEYMPIMKKDRGIKVGVRFFGVCDHGGGPSRRDIELLTDIQSWPVGPTIKFSSLKAFFDDLNQYRDILPVETTERNYIFTGCYSSQSRIKAGNRICEDRLYDAETLSAFSSAFADNKPYANYFKAWEPVLFNQFHDILPGSCVRDARESALGMYQTSLSYSNAGLSDAILKLAQNIDTSSVELDEDRLTTSEGSGVGYHSEFSNFGCHTVSEYGSGKTRILHVFNPTAYDRKEVFQFTLWDYTGDLDRTIATDINGNALELNFLDKIPYWGHTGFLFEVYVDVKSYGYTTVIIKEKEYENLNLHQVYYDNSAGRQEGTYYVKRVLENEFIKAVFDDDMCLEELIDKKSGENLSNGNGGYFLFYEENSKIHMPNAWTEGNCVFSENINRAGTVYSDETVKTTSLGSSIKYEIKYKASNIKVYVFLGKNSRRLEYTIETDWHELGYHNASVPTLRFCMPFTYDCKNYLYDIPMGTIERTERNHDVPARCFAYAPNGDKNGIAVMSNTQGAYRGYNNQLWSTIVRSTSIPDDYPEVGKHFNKISIAVLPNDKQNLFETAFGFIHPLVTASVKKHSGKLSADGSFLKVDGDVVVSGIKTPENGDKDSIIIRLYSVSDKPQTVKLSTLTPIKEAKQVNSLEKVTGNAEITDGCVSVELQKYQATAILIKLR